MARKRHYERDDEAFPHEAYVSRQYRGIALTVLGWETEPDEDTDWTGLEPRTGRVLAIMVGDDFQHSFDPDDLTPLAREEYCGVCGQVGCSHDGYDRETSL